MTYRVEKGGSAMADCGCEVARKNLEDYIHGELGEESCGDIEDHLKECPPCKDEHTVGVVLTNKVKSACCETAPEDLKHTIVQKIQTGA
jgi:anti-sigma factor (TIGR02949 family)